MEVSDYISYVAFEGDLLATTAEKGEMDVPITACEGWDMRDLIRHVGLIHLWAAANVEEASDQWLQVDDLTVLAPHWPELASSWPSDTELVSWYRRTNENLVKVLESKPPDHQCFTFLPAPTPLTMWSRRQASEIAIHRFDAEEARGIPSHFDAAFAADMLDELLAGFGDRRRETAVSSEQTIQVHAHDVDEDWYLTFDPTGMSTSRQERDADLEVAGTAAELYLLFWNRGGESQVTLSGDDHLLELWRDHCRVRWSGA